MLKAACHAPSRSWKPDAFEDPALMLSHEAGDDLLVGRQDVRRRLLVLGHEAAVACSVGGPDDGEAPPFGLG
jgi:hypothetical protein